jgi:hypothetical protein
MQRNETRAEGLPPWVAADSLRMCSLQERRAIAVRRACRCRAGGSVALAGIGRSRMPTNLAMTAGEDIIQPSGRPES